jgi:hypothetical protein
MSDEETTREFSSENDRQQPGRTLDALFSLVESLRNEFTEFRDKIEVRLLRTTPLSETLDAVRADVATIAERQDTLSKTVNEIAKGTRRIENKINGGNWNSLSNSDRSPTHSRTNATVVPN